MKGWFTGCLFALSLPQVAAAQSYARYAPIGDAALYDIFVAYGYDAGWRLRSLLDLDEDVDVLVVDLSAVAPTDEQWVHLTEWVQAGGVLIVGGDASGPYPELGEISSFARCEALDPDFARAGLPLPRLPGETAAYVTTDPIARVLVGCGDPEGMGMGAAVALLDLEVGVVVAIADPALLWNGAFVDPANERFMGELVYLGQGLEGWPVDTPAKLQLATLAATQAPSSGGGGGNNPMAALANAGLLAFVLQLLATWTVLSLWRGWPFSPLQDQKHGGRHAFAAHAEALGTRYWRLRAQGHAAKQVAGFWVSRLGPDGLARAAERAGRTPAEAVRFAARVEALADGPGDGQLSEVDELWGVLDGRTGRR